MKKLFCLSIVLFLLLSCSDSTEIIEDKNTDTLNVEFKDVLMEPNIETLSDDTTEEDIEELIDIIFEDLLQK